jgi:hypothetical protein
VYAFVQVGGQSPVDAPGVLMDRFSSKINARMHHLGLTQQINATAGDRVVILEWNAFSSWLPRVAYGSSLEITSARITTDGHRGLNSPKHSILLAVTAMISFTGHLVVVIPAMFIEDVFENGFGLKTPALQTKRSWRTNTRRIRNRL